jgi:biopolymer transport protein ExbB
MIEGEDRTVGLTAGVSPGMDAADGSCTNDTNVGVEASARALEVRLLKSHARSPRGRRSWRSGSWASWRVLLMSFALVLGTVGASRVLAQANTPAPAPAAAGTATPATVGASSSAPDAGDGKISLMSLFKESFDFFTVLLIIGSLAGWTIIFMVVLEVRATNICPEESEKSILSCIKGQRWGDLREFTQDDDALVSKALRAAINVPIDDKDAVRDAAEMAASEESARWFRKVEPLNVLGNLGPLLGLAGTVWGMILAFAALQSSQGQASPATLSGGIAKALFHTLLGLLLAVPCLTIYGFYRAYIDKLCTRAMVVAGEMVELLPREARVRMGLLGSGGGGPAPAAPRPAVPAPMPGSGGVGPGAGPGR